MRTKVWRYPPGLPPTFDVGALDRLPEWSTLRRTDEFGFVSMTDDEKRALLDWIDRSVIPQKAINHRFTSYGLKHWAERALPSVRYGYVSNDQMKAAMLVSGYTPVDVYALNHVYHARVLKSAQLRCCDTGSR